METSRRLFSTTQSSIKVSKRRTSSVFESPGYFSPTRTFSPFSFPTIREASEKEDDERKTVPDAAENSADASFFDILKYNKNEWPYIVGELNLKKKLFSSIA